MNWFVRHPLGSSDSVCVQSQECISRFETFYLAKHTGVRRFFLAPKLRVGLQKPWGFTVSEKPLKRIWNEGTTCLDLSYLPLTYIQLVPFFQCPTCESGSISLFVSEPAMTRFAFEEKAIPIQTDRRSQAYLAAAVWGS